VHTIGWRVGSAAALDFWERRLTDNGVSPERSEGRLAFSDPEGLRLELVVSSAPDAPLVARHPEIPAALGLQGFDGVRAFASAPGASDNMLGSLLGFQRLADGTWEVRGEARGGLYGYDAPPADRGAGGAGTVHHVAFATQVTEQEAWWSAVTAAGLHPSPIIDRFWFRSIYFREPSGVLFELATLGPGFGVDEDQAHLGERLILPPAFEHLRARVEPALTPLPDPRAGWDH